MRGNVDQRRSVTRYVLDEIDKCYDGEWNGSIYYDLDGHK